jgi:hypothetical protein
MRITLMRLKAFARTALQLLSHALFANEKEETDFMAAQVIKVEHKYKYTK